MRILSITAQKPHSTGSGTYLTELVRAFDRQGFEQAVVAGIYRNDTTGFPACVRFYPVYFSCADSAGDIPFPITGMSDVMPYESTRYRDLTPAMIEEFENAFIKQINAAVEDLDPDVILCHHLFLLTALVRKHFPDRKVYGISHGTDLRQMLSCEYLAGIVRPEINNLDRIFALHSEQAENIAEIFSPAPERIQVIGSGYNSHLFNTDNRTERKAGDPVRICYAGKMSKAKGVPELLTVLERLAADDSVMPFSVKLAGGCQDADVRALIDQLPDGIEYLDQIPQRDLAALFKSSDIFILPSYFEGLNLAVIEAMASGLLPICTDLPGMKTWIDSNVAGANIRYIPMPEMHTIDAPTDAGRAAFIRDMEGLVRNAITDIASGHRPEQPDTSGITWDSVAAKISAI